MSDPTAPDPRRPGARVLELTPEGPRRRFLLVIPAADVAARHAARLAELRLTGEGGGPEWSGAVRDRVASAALADACRAATEETLGALLRRLPAIVGRPELDTLAGPPDGDLIIRAGIWILPEPALPDPATLRIERLVPLPDPAEEARALAALAATRAAEEAQPEGTPAQAGDSLVCDIVARLLPAANRLPRPGLDGAAAGAPGRLPEGWSFGDNGVGLRAEVVEVAASADPPFLRLRVHGMAAADGQSFLIFHQAGAIPARPGVQYSGSVALRAVGVPAGLRGAKLRLESQGASAEGRLRRKDAAVGLRIGAEGFTRCYVSDRMIEDGTAFLRLPLLFDHAAGKVDFTLDIAAPRLVEGMDLGAQPELPLPEFSGRGRRFRLGDPPDAAGLAPRLEGLAAGETRAITLRLPDTLEDRALAGREARFEVRVATLLRRVTPAVDEALARAMGFAGLDGLRAFVARRVAEHHAALAERQARAALLDALLAAAGAFPVPPPALQAEMQAVQGRMPQAGQAAILAEATRRLRTRLLLGAVARRHGLAPDEAALRVAAGRPGAPPIAELRARAIEDNALGFLMARAQVTERTVSAAMLAEMAAR